MNDLSLLKDPEEVEMCFDGDVDFCDDDCPCNLPRFVDELLCNCVMDKS